MFNFLDMVDNYEERLVANDKRGDAVIDTVSVTDSDDPFETAVQHPQYNNANWVVVETYKSYIDALAGHDKWIKAMTADILPAKLVDVSTSQTAQFVDAVIEKDDNWREHTKD